MVSLETDDNNNKNHPNKISLKNPAKQSTINSPQHWIKKRTESIQNDK